LWNVTGSERYLLKSDMRMKLKVLLCHQLNYGNPSQESFTFVIPCQPHPTGFLKTVTLLLESRLQLWTLMACVERGGNSRDKYNMINSLTCNQFITARANKQHTTTWTLPECGVAASFQFTSPVFPIKASAGWLRGFKKE
jgi:hypothetical protein